MSESQGLTPRQDFLKAAVSAANFARSPSPQEEYRLNYNKSNSGGPAFEVYFSTNIEKVPGTCDVESRGYIRHIQLSNVDVVPYKFDVIAEIDANNKNRRIHRPARGDGHVDHEVAQKVCDFLNFHQVNYSVIER